MAVIESVSGTSGTATAKSKFGVVIETSNSDGTTSNFFDPFGRVFYTEKDGRSVDWIGYNNYGDIEEYDVFYKSSANVYADFYEYDNFGNRIAATNALGNVTKSAYDAENRLAGQGGATYPTRFGYDTQGRRTSLKTTRDGSTWDETQWEYDATTGLCTAKEYADSSRVLHTFTPDGKPLRTTYASGRHAENTYNAKRELVSTSYSDGEATQITYDGFSRESSVSNSAATIVYSRDTRGNATNETFNILGETATIVREYDAFGRLVQLGDTHYFYAEDGKLATVSNSLATVEYSYSTDRMDAGYMITLPNGTVVGRALSRDAYRRSLVTNIVSTANGTTISSLAYTYDALNRPIQRNSDTFGYNIRSEVTSARISGYNRGYGYDEIGNSTWWTANNLNQYTHLDYDLDGNLLSDGIHVFTYDAANRLATVSTNGVLVATNYYDAKSRRVRKETPDATSTYFYDDWNLVEERIAYTSGITSTIHYYWGKDLSGTFQGAGGVGGLLYLTIDNALYIPCYDSNGNITHYLDASGNIAASYTYDAFGNIIAQSGSLVDTFRHRFSTKYYDAETDLYYYGYRFYHPTLMRWLNRDPIEEKGGMNVYSFCKNNAVYRYDKDGCAYFAYRPLDFLPLRKLDVTINFDWMDRNNVAVLHEQLLFEDGGIPTNLGYFDDSQVRSDTAGIQYSSPHSRGWNDCIMRKAVQAVRPRPYSLLGDKDKGLAKYNCQDWAAEVRLAYWTIASGRIYRPWGYTEMRAR